MRETRFTCQVFFVFDLLAPKGAPSSPSFPPHIARHLPRDRGRRVEPFLSRPAGLPGGKRGGGGGQKRAKRGLLVAKIMASLFPLPSSLQPIFLAKIERAFLPGLADGFVWSSSSSALFLPGSIFSVCPWPAGGKAACAAIYHDYGTQISPIVSRRGERKRGISNISSF